MPTCRVPRPQRNLHLLVAAALLPGLLTPLARAYVLQKPAHLRCDDLTTPIGLDTAQPQLSWQLQDDRVAAKQSAYEVQVATRSELLQAGKADVWDSGRVESEKSVGVAYAGPALKAESRYYWRVKVWDRDGKVYPASDVSWWETGLMDSSGWRGKWIGYELTEERSIRESGALWIANAGGSGVERGQTEHDFLRSFTVSGAVRRAHLYVTGKDTVSAWVNGKQVLTAEPLPPWKQTAWKKYQEVDVTADVKQGVNLLAVEAVLYSLGSNGDPNTVRTAPMSACLYLEMSDGSVTLIKSDESWKAMLNAPGGWEAPGYSDDGWKNAVQYLDQSGKPDTDRPWPTGPVKMLRREFEAAKPVRSARLYVTALGAYKFSINGRVVGDQILAPGWTDFRSHVVYQVYDVTTDVKAGANAIGAYLAPGWYATPLQWDQAPNNYGKTPPALKAQLRVEYADGSVDWVATDETWKADVSPILKAEIYDGETYDARREQAGWSTAGFRDAHWKPVEVVQPLEPAIVAQDFQPIRVEKTLPAKAVTSPRPGMYVFDFGQNMAGVAGLHASGTAGTEVQLRFAEVLNPDGTIYTENLRTAKATDRYILAGKGVEEYQPRFTFHGFRYVEVTGLTSKPEI